MRDGRTRKMADRCESLAERLAQFQREHQVAIVVVAGGDEGTRYEIEGARMTIGRGPGVDVAIDDETLSRQHAAFDFEGSGYTLHDLGSTNGVLVDGQRVTVHPLEHGSRFRLGDREFQFLVDSRVDEPETYVLEL